MAKCKICEKQPHEIYEYVSAAKAEGITPLEFVEENEGTYNPEKQLFYCTNCYVDIGMPFGKCGAPVFDNEVYEQQRKNIEALAAENQGNWFYESQMKLSPDKRTGFAPQDRKCHRCNQDVTQGEKGITLESLGNYIITGCPHCFASFCD